MGLTSDRDDPLIAGQTLLEFGIENQNISLQKEDFKCKTSVFGITVTTLNSYEMLYMFVNKLKKAASVYGEDLAIQTSIEHYKEFIKNINKNIEKQRDMPRKQEMKE